MDYTTIVQVISEVVAAEPAAVAATATAAASGAATFGKGLALGLAVLGAGLGIGKLARRWKARPPARTGRQAAGHDDKDAFIEVLHPPPTPS